MEIEITRYNDSMRPQVIKLFEDQYGSDPVEFEKLFRNFYFHPFQKDKCLLVVALDGTTVAGFQSFFYWPYSYNGKVYNSFQSGNSIVHPSYRGKGIFNRMLEYIDRESMSSNIDLLMGFPVNESLKNFIKDKWTNILDLKWYVKPCNVFGFFGGLLLRNKKFSEGNEHFENGITNDIISMPNDKGFNEWRKSYQTEGKHFSFRYKKGTHEIIIHLKKNKRKKLINELIIGAMLFNGKEAIAYAGAAIEDLVMSARKSYAVHFLSISVNEESKINLRSELDKLGFKRTDKQIHFIVKPFKGNEFATIPSNWFLSRSDVDTW